MRLAAQQHPARRGGHVWVILTLVFCLLGASSPLAAKSHITWHQDKQHVDVDIDGWALDKLLKEIAATTHWQIFVDPEAQCTVSARFNDTPLYEALNRLLGNLNFALLPQTNGPARFYVFRNSVQDATHSIEPAASDKQNKTSKDLIPNELIVTLKPGSKQTIDQIAALLGAKVVGRADALNAYRLQFASEEDARQARTQLSGNENVAGVDSNYYLHRPTQTDALAYSSFPLNVKATSAGSSGQVIIGLVDTAVQTEGSRIKDFLLAAQSVAGNATVSADQPTHGTAMAESIVRAANDGTLRILPVDVYGNNETTTTYDVANGIYVAIKNGATIINLSLGGDGENALLHQVIEDGYKNGVRFVASAGNSPTGVAIYPAGWEEVTAVTAGDKNGNILSWANYGSFVDAVAPGTSVVQYNQNSYMVTGTSVSTAYFSGLAASQISKSGSTVAKSWPSVVQSFATKSTTKP